MRLWRGILIVAVPFAAAAAIFLLRPAVPPETARNVILISIDTLRADHLGCYGYERPTSPNIDAFARRGALFEHAISTSGWTVPAHMSMLTGLDPLGHGANGYPSPRNVVSRVDTLAEILKRHGLQTAAFVGGGYLGPRSGFKRGFDTYSTKGRHFTHNISDAREWVRAHRNERFFLFFHGYDVHRPYLPSRKNKSLFSADYNGGFKVEDLAPDMPRPSEQDLEFAISQYDASIRDVDDLLGDLLAEWEGMGLLDETLVLIVSDHGDEFYEHGQIYHAHSLYEELLRIPFIAVGPGVAPGRHETQVSLIDITPTTLAALGFVGEGTDMHGIDLTPVLRGESDPPERLLFSFLGFSNYPYSIAALRSDDWKLIAWDVAGMNRTKFRTTSKEYTHKFRLDHDENFEELFDLRNDPHETRTVDEPATRERFAAILQGRLKENLQGARKPEKKPKLSPKEIEDLKALGYL